MIKPIIYEEYVSSYLGVNVTLALDYNICFIIGDSATGKSFLWQILNDDSTITPNLVTYNYHDINKDIFKDIKEQRGKLIVIDNSDILLSLDAKKHIAFDTNNQYILIGRDCNGLFLSKEQFKEIRFDNKHLYLENAF